MAAMAAPAEGPDHGQAAHAYAEGLRCYELARERHGTHRVHPSVVQVAHWMSRGLASAFQAGWYDGSEADAWRGR